MTIYQFWEFKQNHNIYIFALQARALREFSAMAKFTKIICQKKSRTKSLHPISPKLNQTNLHTSGLILISYGVNWSKIVAVTFFVDKFTSFCLALHHCAHFLQYNAKKLLKFAKICFIQKLTCMLLWYNST